MNPDLPRAPGLHDRELELSPGCRVRCTIALPPGLVPAAPLVLCLHYGGEPRGYYGRPLLEHLLLPAWAGLGAVMVAPVSVGGDWTTPDNARNAFELISSLLPGSVATDEDERTIEYHCLDLGQPVVEQLKAEEQAYARALVPGRLHG